MPLASSSLLHLGRKILPHQHFGEIDRRRDQHHARELGLRAPVPELTREQQREPAAHRGADQNLRPVAKSFEDGEAFLEPASDRAVGEPALGLAVPRIVETNAGAAGACSPRRPAPRALVPFMSDLNPPSQTMPGALPGLARTAIARSSGGAPTSRNSISGSDMATTSPSRTGRAVRVRSIRSGALYADAISPCVDRHWTWRVDLGRD